MKIRKGFVTNSSSSSFIIHKMHLNRVQIDNILEHGKYAEKDSWHIEETENFIKGYTSMDNFDMGCFLKLLGIDEKLIEWD